MRRILPLSLLLASLGSVVVLAGSCQTYDFEPVVPLAISQKTNYKQIAASFLKPNMMLVVDKSGSMGTHIPKDCSTCPTRLTEMRSAMHTFLTTYPTTARLGLLFFPQPPPGQFSNAALCTAPTLDNVRVQVGGADDNATLTATANSIDNAVQSEPAAGGTPTALTLDLFNAYGPLQDVNRPNFILLLTDGEPNCNANNPNTCSNTTACRCTLSSGCGADTCTLGCLDMDNSVQVITALRAKGIRTIVVGFGDETTAGNAPLALTAMANAGGFPRLCPNGTDAECGTGDTCNLTNRTCNRPYYQAGNSTELATALGQIGSGITEKPCEAKLSEKPSDVRFLSVLVNGTAVASGPDTWSYDSAAGQVNFQGALCEQLKTSTTANPINLEFRIVQAL